MMDDRHLIDTIRKEWAPERPHPGAFDAALQRRLQASRRRRVAIVGLAAAAAMATVFVTTDTAPPPHAPAHAPVIAASPVEAPAADPWLDDAAALSGAAIASDSLDQAMPDEYAALSALFLDPYLQEGT